MLHISRLTNQYYLLILTNWNVNAVEIGEVGIFVVAFNLN